MTSAKSPKDGLARLRADQPIGWAVSPGRIGYEDAVSYMEQRSAEIRAGTADELVWLLEHDPLYTGGTGAKPQDLLQGDRFPVYASSRGGQYTYHGPGQRVAYVMLDLERRGKDIRSFVYGLEQWLIDALDAFNVKGERRDGRVGVWVDRTAPGGTLREDKIAAIGVRVRRWVTFHGIAFNVEPDLTHFTGITPCGVAESGLGVTSLVDLGLPVTLDDADDALRRTFESVFGPTLDASAPSW
ncbi:MAG: lipoyl(octanoyl) transferase LipB [Pseudomonadota bacterium]